MKNKSLWIMCGCPGSGKTTYAKEMISQYPQYKFAYISRDEIRFSLLGDNYTDYFSKEDEVFSNYIFSIQSALNDLATDIVIADATQLNSRSRNKLMSKLTIPEGTDLIAITFELSLDTCLAQNRKRFGTKSYAPEDSLIQMYNSYSAPNDNDMYSYKIVPVKEI